MTRATQVSHAVNALREARAATDAVSEPASMAFLIYEDNGGFYHWTLVADGGEMLVRSAGFASYGQAKHAAEVVQRGAARASFQARPGDPSPDDLPGHRDAVTAQGQATAGDRSDDERRTHEGGSFSSEAVAR